MAAASTVAAQMVQLSELFNAAGAGDSIKQYLAAKKISTTPTLALIAKNAEDFMHDDDHSTLHRRSVDRRGRPQGGSRTGGRRS